MEDGPLVDVRGDGESHSRREATTRLSQGANNAIIAVIAGNERRERRERRELNRNAARALTKRAT
jgi:hypothetical protein